MKRSLQTRPRIGYEPRRRRKKQPSSETLQRVEWLEWLVEQFGPESVAEWQEPPMNFDEWKLARQLAAHEAA